MVTKPLPTNEIKTKSKRVSITFTQPSQTKQAFKDQTDINKIIERFTQTGELPPVNQTPVYQDVSQIPDFATCQLKVKQAEEAFMSLPSDVRNHFGNNPDNLLKWASDPKNFKSASDLGLVGTPEPAKTVETEALSNKKELEKDAKK